MDQVKKALEGQIEKINQEIKKKESYIYGTHEETDEEEIGK
jgi:hypothetical protein